MKHCRCMLSEAASAASLASILSGAQFLKKADVLIHHCLSRVQAIHHYNKHLELNPEDQIARFWLAVLRGDADSAPMCPASMVADLFDQYADKFDQHLVEQLGYETPDLLLHMLQRHQDSDGHPAEASTGAVGVSNAPGASSGGSLASAVQGLQLDGGAGASSRSNLKSNLEYGRCVDLGCGTGLMGPLLRPLVQRLEGVDLSSGMVTKARDRGCYDHLAVTELVAYLDGSGLQDSSDGSNRAPGDQPYDLLVAADVFVYIGDLRPAFESAARCAGGGALFLFSTETLDTLASGLTLQPTGRFAHSRAYLEQLCRETGWQPVAIEAAVIRYNAGLPIHGNLCLLRRAAAAAAGGRSRQ